MTGHAFFPENLYTNGLLQTIIIHGKSGGKSVSEYLQKVYKFGKVWYDIKNIYLKETKCGKSPTTLVKEVGELAGQKNNNVNDGLNRHFEEVYKRQNVA